MSFATRSHLDENTRNIDDIKGSSKAPLGSQASSRRALGDIGNLVGNLSHGTGKESLKDGELTDRSQGGQSQRTEVAALLNNLRKKAAVGSWGGSRPRTTNFRPRESYTTLSSTSSSSAVRGGGNSSIDGHKSITSLLISRSEAASCRKGERPDLPDIDAADRKNPLAVTAYVNDIYTYYKRIEHETQISPDYMSEQTDINDKMRAILIDWLVEVHLKFKLMPETLFLTENLIDRFLAKQTVTRKNLQLVGVTAMLIAAKYEEIWAPEVRDFIYISDKAYNRAQILDMEKLMLRRLGFNLTVPTPYHFLARFLKSASADKQCELLAMFLTELSLPDYTMLKYSSSLRSAAAVYTALATLGRPHFPSAFAAHCGFKESELRPCAIQLVHLHRRAPSATLLAVHKKYSTTKFMEVAKQPPALGLLDAAASE